MFLLIVFIKPNRSLKYTLLDSPLITFIYNFGNYLSRILTQDAAKGMDILFTMKLKMLKRNEFFFIILLNIFTFREKGITTLRIYQYCKFHHTVIKTCFEMLTSSEHEIWWRCSIYNTPIFKIVLKLDQLIFQFHFTIKF